MIEATETQNYNQKRQQIHMSERPTSFNYVRHTNLAYIGNLFYIDFFKV